MKTTTTKKIKEFECLECRRAMTLRAAEKAMSVGCPGCGGVDIDLKVSA